MLFKEIKALAHGDNRKAIAQHLPTVVFHLTPGVGGPWLQMSGAFMRNPVFLGVQPGKT